MALREGLVSKRAKLLSSAMGFPLFPQATQTEICIFRSILNNNSLSTSDFSFYPLAITQIDTWQSNSTFSRKENSWYKGEVDKHEKSSALHFLIILLGTLKPVSHFRTDEEATKAAHKILNLNRQQGVAFYHNANSVPFTNTGQRGYYQETMEKEHNIFPFSMVWGQKQEGDLQDQCPSAWPKDAFTGTTASAAALSQASSTSTTSLLWFEKQKANALTLFPRNLFCLALLLWRQKTPHYCWRIFVSLTLKIIDFNP